MKTFRTEIVTQKSTTLIDLHDLIVTIGSCFADTIGNKLTENKFNTITNPFGVIYNPYSIHTALRYAIHNQPVPEHTFLENNEVNLNYNFHSSLSSFKKVSLDKKLKEIIGTLHYTLKSAQWLLITYGTSWVYTRKDTGEIVANCHKMPGDLFTKELLTQKRMIDSFDEFFASLKSLNKNIQIILTVSPVRHLKDTLELNSVSKSVLRLGCHTLSEQHPDVHYFPAYELLMDDLRDYRFYKSDMIHPSEEAEEYIWRKFIHSWCQTETIQFITKWNNILTKLNHKPFHPETTAHQSFLKELLASLVELKAIINVDNEIAVVKSQIL